MAALSWTAAGRMEDRSTLRSNLRVSPLRRRSILPKKDSSADGLSGFVGVAKVFFREADEAPGIIELGLEGEDHLGAIDVVRDFLNPDARFVLDGVLETLLEFGRATEAVHDGGGHAVGGFDAAGAVAVEPEFFIALDAGGEGEDQSEEENAAHRLSVIGYQEEGSGGGSTSDSWSEENRGRGK